MAEPRRGEGDQARSPCRLIPDAVADPSPSARAQTSPASPLITVVLPTRNRGTSVLTPIAAILRGSCQDFEICVIDQSVNAAETAAALTAVGDGRIRHLTMPDGGLARAINRGIEAATSELLAVTGDDCEPASDWLALIVAAFASDPSIGIVHGNVEPCRHDANREFVQASLRCDALVARVVGDVPALVGTSANMALRRSVAALVGFDEALGVGGPLAAAEDLDFALRSLLGGWAVYEDPTIRVVHMDVWPLRRRNDLIHRNWFGTGAVFAKFLRLRPLPAILLLAKLARRWIGTPVGVSSAIGGGNRWRRLMAFTRGFLVGITRPLDHVSGHFRGSSPRHRGA